MRKHVLIAFTALGLVLSGAAAAGGDSVSDNTLAAFDALAQRDDNATAIGYSKAFSESLNENNLTHDESINDSYNRTATDSGNTSLSNIGNTTDSYNLRLNVNTVVAKADLEATVSGNYVYVGGRGGELELAMENRIDGDAMGGATGFVWTNQNTGANSLIQQNVSMNANMSVGSR